LLGKRVALIRRQARPPCRFLPIGFHIVPALAVNIAQDGLGGASPLIAAAFKAERSSA
jgi:hypothetical protein